MGLIWIAGAALWGIAEATFFFLVPDVLLTLAAMRFGWKAGLKLSVVAAAAASLAGIAMWMWGRHDIAGARHAMLMVPAIGPDLLARAVREMGQGWPLHLVTGAMTGVPYKLYAVEAGARGLDPLAFAAMSFVARLIRFVLTVALAAGGRWLAQSLGKPKLGIWGWGVAWIAVYAIYFTLRAVA